MGTTAMSQHIDGSAGWADESATAAACRRWWHIRLQQELDPLLFANMTAPPSASPEVEAAFGNRPRSSWGDDSELIDDWFRHGDQADDGSSPLLDHIDTQPSGRAARWVRSFAWNR